MISSDRSRDIETERRLTMRSVADVSQQMRYILEDSSSVALPDALAQLWRGCGGNQGHTAAAVKLHVRWELKRGQVWGPKLTHGRTSDHQSPFKDESVPPGSLSINDLGYFDLR